MEQALYIILGWLFGLLSPAILSKIAEPYRRRSLFKAISSELKDLKFRAALANFRLVQGYGEVNSKYLAWVKPHIENYDGNEPNETTLKLLAKMLELNESQLIDLNGALQAQAGVGVSLKTHSVSFLNSHIESVSLFPINLQTRIHELLNQINIINQEVERANESLRMTFDSSISPENHDRLIDDLKCNYRFISNVYKNIIEKIDYVIEYKI